MVGNDEWGGQSWSGVVGTGRKRPETAGKRSETVGNGRKLPEIAGNSWKWSVKWSGLIRNDQLVGKWSETVGNLRKRSEMVGNGRKQSETIRNSWKWVGNGREMVGNGRKRPGNGRKRLETVGNGQWSGQGWSENKWWNEYFYQTIYSNKLSFCSWPSPPTTRHLWPLLPCWGINIPTYRAHQPCQVWSSSYCIVTYNMDDGWTFRHHARISLWTRLKVNLALAILLIQVTFFWYIWNRGRVKPDSRITDNHHHLANFIKKLHACTVSTSFFRSWNWWNGFST